VHVIEKCNDDPPVDQLEELLRMRVLLNGA